MYVELSNTENPGKQLQITIIIDKYNEPSRSSRLLLNVNNLNIQPRYTNVIEAYSHEVSSLKMFIFLVHVELTTDSVGISK